MPVDDSRVSAILALSNDLTPEERQKVKRSLNDDDPLRLSDIPEHALWMSLDDVAKWLGKSPSQISRDAKNGKLWSNGKKGKKFRMFTLSALAMSRRIEAKITLKLLDMLRGFNIPDREIAALVHVASETANRLIPAFGDEYAVFPLFKEETKDSAWKDFEALNGYWKRLETLLPKHINFLRHADLHHFLETDDCPD